MKRLAAGTTSALFALLCACGDDDDPADGGHDAGAPLDAAADAGPSDAGPADAGSPQDVCDELGLARAAMLPGEGHGYGEVAGDFTVETLAGTVTFSEAFSGCESYVFVNFADTAEGRSIFAAHPAPLLEGSARNVQYFFTSYETDAAAVRRRMETLQVSFEDAYAAMDPVEAERWRRRIHFVTTPLLEIGGSPGERARNQPGIHYAFAIDRAQRFDQVGSLAEITSGGFVPRLSMARWASRYYDYRAALEERLRAEADATVVRLVSETDFSERVFQREVTLPDAAAMAAFDALAVDVEVVCRREARDCSEWDRIAKIEVCTDATCADKAELVRWITPYARPGSRRWLMDATALLGLLRAGGATRFEITMGPSWERATERDVEISLRLRATGAADAASGAELAFRGGAFDADYNTGRGPFRFTPPAGTRRVELVVIVSGHGQSPGDNCAEWCNHEHTFALNGRSGHLIDYRTGIGAPQGCAERAGEGVVPGQYGNWAPARAGWCPGLPVETVRIDVTSEVDLAAENELTYRGSFRGIEPRGGDIDLSALVAYFE